MLLGAVVGGLLAAVIGTIVAVVAIRVSGLLLALVTLAFALFADQSLFQYSWTGGGLTGVTVPRPLIGSIDFGYDRTFLVLCFLALVLCSVLVLLVQRGTVGRYLAAMRGSPVAAASMGISLQHGATHRVRHVGGHRPGSAGRCTARSSSRSTPISSATPSRSSSWWR